MDLQNFLSKSIQASRAKVFAESDQLSLGQIISKCESIMDSRSEDEAPLVYFDFCNEFPTKIDSWRGIYAELALDHQTEGQPCRLSEFIDILTQSVGRIFEGYKGGEFLMNLETPVWVDNWGRAGNTAVIDVVDAGWRVLLITAYRES